MLHLLLRISSGLTATDIRMMERITRHLPNNSRLVGATIIQIIIIIKNILENLTLKSLRIIILLYFLISCFLYSHVFKVFNDFERRGFMHVWVLLRALNQRRVADDIFNGNQLLFRDGTLAGQIRVHLEMVEVAKRIVLRDWSWNVFD